jgi:hypothetical protein
MLGVVAQCMAEITVLAEKGGVSRADFFDFLNDSVMGSMFTRYKTPAIVNLDFTPTFTPALLYKDFSLGFEAAEEHGVPMPVAAAAQQAVQAPGLQLGPFVGRHPLGQRVPHGVHLHQSTSRPDAVLHRSILPIRARPDCRRARGVS